MNSMIQSFSHFLLITALCFPHQVFAETKPNWGKTNQDTLHQEMAGQYYNVANYHRAQAQENRENAKRTMADVSAGMGSFGAKGYNSGYQASRSAKAQEAETINSMRAAEQRVNAADDTKNGKDDDDRAAEKAEKDRADKDKKKKTTNTIVYAGVGAIAGGVAGHFVGNMIQGQGVKKEAAGNAKVAAGSSTCAATGAGCATVAAGKAEIADGKKDQAKGSILKQINWTGALIGAGLGAAAGAMFAQMSAKDTKQAAKAQKKGDESSNNARDVGQNESPVTVGGDGQSVGNPDSRNDSRMTAGDRAVKDFANDYGLDYKAVKSAALSTDPNALLKMIGKDEMDHWIDRYAPQRTLNALLKKENSKGNMNALEDPGSKLDALAGKNISPDAMALVDRLKNYQQKSLKESSPAVAGIATPKIKGPEEVTAELPTTDPLDLPAAALSPDEEEFRKIASEDNNTNDSQILDQSKNIFERVAARLRLVLAR